MRFMPTELKDAYIIEPELYEDNRGFFARVWAQNEFAEHGLVNRVVQMNLSYNRVAGTLRGMHFQHAPYAETKLVRCIRGAIYDVIIDLRPDSPTYKRWIGVKLTAANRLALYVPEGFAHGFQTLEDDTEVFYQVSQYYTPSAEGGVRYNDPAFGIIWPLPVTEMSEKDKRWQPFTG
ncbi:dTDP-4-dehydrorhamnose 3,5-epimerase [uncultured Chloroflexus sp.]|uniref:dTDP-4-dehydrorhamnose 3,5-epimerase n=1 Tax=uncultured Chloroflexus sp. TaxID=214040 RepID=UPI00260DED6F|nr:dTDP-4-dehydrorhamnose 3,5-epimerase [uncultured Chloroflexus sp.]